MAKRRRRDDDKKIQKGKKHSHKRHRLGDGEDEDDEYTSRERKAPRMASQRRWDLSVMIGVVIVIVIILGGYLFYTNFFDSYFGTNENNNNGSNTNIVPNTNNNNNNGNSNSNYEIPAFSTSDSNNPVAIIEVRDYGVIVVELYQNKNVQITVDNFLNYARRGFYNGLIFHRVIDGFMIQGGGFYQDMTEKDTPADMGPIPLEIDPTLHHVDGALAMARTSDPNSATSQFFIDDGAQPNLEPGGVDQYGYAVFGKVVAGMNIVREISAVETHSEGYYDDVPVNDIIINKIYEYTGPQ